MRPLLAGFLALLLTAGATVALLPREAPSDPGETGEDVSRAGVVDAEEARTRGVGRPEWRPGQSWAVSFSPSGFGCRLVVAQAGPEGARQGAACDGARALVTEEAFFDYPYLGAFGPDLEGLTQHEAGPVRFYDWPLVDGKRWSASWRGRDVEVEATFVPDLPGPGGEEPGFLLEMTAEGELIATYDYVPSQGWWSFLELANGFRMDAWGYDPSWHGEAVLAEARPRVALDEQTNFASITFPVPDDDDLLLVYRGVARTHVQHALLLDPDGEVAHRSALLPVLGPTVELSYVQPKAGLWRIFPTHVGVGQATLVVRGIAFTDATL